MCSFIKKINFSYHGIIEIEYQFYRISFSVNTLLKHAIFKYDNITIDKNYFPYSYGIDFNLKYSLKDKFKNRRT